MSVASLASRLPPIPPSIANTGIGLSVPATMFTRCMSVSRGQVTSLDELEESMATKADSNNMLGTTLIASEDLEAILQKMRTSMNGTK